MNVIVRDYKLTEVESRLLQPQANNVTMLYSKAEIDEMIFQLHESIDTSWLIVATIMIFTMKLGFALLEVGSVRIKNTSNILLKNIVDTVTGALIYYMIGFGLQFDQQGGIIGQGKFAAQDFNKPRDYLQFLFSFSFCATSTTIVSGALAERVYTDTYLVYSVIMTGFLNPIAAGWAWGGGWLQILGFHDFSGSGIVHLIGGTAGFWGTYICGARLGRFGKQNLKTLESNRGDSLDSNDVRRRQNNQRQNRNFSNGSDKSPRTNSNGDVRATQIKFEQSQTLPSAMRLQIFKKEHPEFSELDNQSVLHLIRIYDQNFDMKIQSNSLNSIVQGVFILFVTWLFFNGASGFTIVHRNAQNLPQMIVMNTILAGSSGAITVYMCKNWILKKLGYTQGYQIIDVCSGLLAGLVSVTAGCNNVSRWGALIIGIIGALVYIFSCIFMMKYEIDDPVEATQVHGFCGLWGVLAVGFFDIDNGLLLTGDSRQLGVQTFGAVMLFIWSSTLSIAYFYMMKKMNRLRVDPIFEIIGLDAVMHEECEKFNHVPTNSIKVAIFKRDMKRPQNQSQRSNSSVEMTSTEHHQRRNKHSNI